MKKINLVHNPKAGDAEHSGEKLRTWLTDEGYICSYFSTDDMTSDMCIDDADLIVVAGGDGTVRKTVIKLMNSRVPLALLPLGTANNIAKSIGAEGEHQDLIRRWKNSGVIHFDIGKIKSFSGEDHFLESVGFGLFPKLIRAVKKEKEESRKTQKKIRNALKILREIIPSYEARYAEVELDGQLHTGKFLMTEVMNTPSIGPNLTLDPLANPADGKLNVVLIEESEREKLKLYIDRKLEEKDEPNFFNIIKATSIRIHWEGRHFHIDDALIPIDELAEVEIEILPGKKAFIG